MATTASIAAYLLPGVPVHQPPHLEGDSSLATEILPGPPSLVSAQQAAQKRDPKKPSTNYSYLPPSDPGSTYSGIMHGTLIGQDLEGHHSKRSRNDKGTATGRAQRASARSQGNAASILDPAMPVDAGTSSVFQPIPLDSDSGTVILDEEPLLISRSNSTHNLMEPPKDATAVGLKKKDKGKGKEVEMPPLRVKEEPKSFSLHTPEPSNNLLGNEDHCSSCSSVGALVYCDGCPRAFHLWCLDPPMEGVDEGDARWFCPMCVARKHPPHKPPASLLSVLIHQVQISNPVEFQLPDEVKYFFKDVACGQKGTYIDSAEIKPIRLNRHGQVEERDPHRLRDRNGDAVLCFRCGLSALPATLAASIPPNKRPRRAASKATSPEIWKNIVSCDYCTLHWHLDCLDPPLSTLPPLTKKWMCPNHSERVLPPKHRIPKLISSIEIVKPRQYNNGNIEVTHPEASPSLPNKRVAVEEVLINGRRYRVPERIIVLDFWHKLNRNIDHRTSEPDATSGMSSPLTSLSSWDDSDEPILPPATLISQEMDDLSAAKLLCGFALTKRLGTGAAHSSLANGVAQKLEATIQAEVKPPTPSPIRNKVGRPRKHPLPNAVGLNGSKPVAVRSESTSATPGLTISAIRKRRAPQPPPIERTTRELRSRSKNNNADTPLTSISSRSSVRHVDDLSSKDSLSFDGSLAAPSNQAKGKSVSVKLEEIDSTQALYAEPLTSSSTALSKRPMRTPRPSKPKDTETPRKETKERRGRKRKVRDDELPTVDGENGFENPDNRDSAKKLRGEKPAKVEAEAKKAIRTPAKLGRLQATTTTTTPTSTSTAVASPSLPITPSLKIRLPRLSNINISGNHNSHGKTDSPLRR